VGSAKIADEKKKHTFVRFSDNAWRETPNIDPMQKLLTITIHINLIACSHEGTFICHHTNESKHQHEEEDKSKHIEQKL
jgi:hypothetical protein